MTGELANNDAETAERLARLRGGAPLRSPSVRVVAAFAQNTQCQLATLGFAAGIDFDRLLVGTRYQAPFGQSPFAIQRGLAFERMLRANEYASTKELLREPLRWPVAPHVVNLRDGFPSGVEWMPARLAATEKLLRSILGSAKDAPHYVDGAVLRATVGGIVAYFEADALAVQPADREIRVAEVKSFPKVDDRVDPEQLGAALDQVAVYVYLTRLVVRDLGGEAERVVSDRAMLITPRNVGLMPTLSEQTVGSRVTRVERVLRAIPNAEDVVAAAPTRLSFGDVADVSRGPDARVDALHDIANRIPTAYTPSCLTTCGNARFCRARSVGAGSPCVMGMPAVRHLPEVVSLGRAAGLSRGEAPTSAESPVATFLERAGRLIDEATSTGRSS